MSTRTTSQLIDEAYNHIDDLDYASAIDLFGQALKREPSNESATCGEIAARRLNGELSLADQLASAAVQKFPNSADAWYERGAVYRSLKRYSDALLAFDRTLAIDPDYELAVLAKIRALRGTGRDGDLTGFTEAHAVLKKALAKFPGNQDFVTEKGWLFFDRGHFPKATEVFIASDNEAALEKLLSQLRTRGGAGESDKFGLAEQLIAKILPKFPKSTAILIEWAQLHEDQDNHDKSISIVDQALAIDPNNESAIELKLVSLRLGERYTEAEIFMAEALRRLPKSSAILTQRGLLYYAQDAFGKAAATLREALAIDPTDEFTRKWLSITLRFEARSIGYQTPEETMRETLSLFPDSAELWAERGWLHYDQQAYEAAVKAFERVIKLNPESDLGYVGKIDALRADWRSDEALKTVNESVEKHPTSVKLLTRRGELQCDRRQFEKAVAIFDQILAKDGKNASAARLRIFALRSLAKSGKNGKLDELLGSVDQAIKLSPKSSELLIERGWLLFDLKRLEEAEESFSKAAELNRNLTTVFALTEFYSKLNRFEQALSALQPLSEDAENRLEVSEQLGWLYLGRGDIGSAEKEFKAMLESDATNELANNGLGAIHFELHNYVESTYYFRKVVDKRGKSPTFYTNLAWSLVRQGDPFFAEAEQLCKDALKLDRTYVSAYGCLGVIEFKRGNLRRSEEYFRESIRVNLSEGAYLELGALYVQTGKYDEAATALQTALQNDPNDEQVHIELGNLYLQTEKLQAAISEFRQAVAVEPRSEEAHRSVAIALMKVGNLDEAERVLRAAIKSLDKNKRCHLHLTLAQLLTKRGDDAEEQQYYDEALAQAKAAIQLEPNQAEVYLNSGIIRYKLGNYARALLDFQHCLRLDKDNYEADRNARLVRARLVKERSLQVMSVIGAVALALLCLGQLGFIWKLFLTGKVSDKTLIVLVPILLGMFVVAFLLPVLARLKLPGFEAELSQPKPNETISSGPKGSVGFADTTPSLSSGPK